MPGRDPAHDFHALPSSTGAGVAVPASMTASATSSDTVPEWRLGRAEGAPAPAGVGAPSARRSFFEKSRGSRPASSRVASPPATWPPAPGFCSASTHA